MLVTIEITADRDPATLSDYEMGQLTSLRLHIRNYLRQSVAAQTKINFKLKSFTDET